VIELAVACLGAGLAVAIVAVILLAVTLPRRVARQVAHLLVEDRAKEQAKSRTQALAVRASAAELASIVEASRRLLNEHVLLLLNEHAQIVGAVRSLAEWLAERASAFEARDSAAVETVRKNDAPPPMSRERPSLSPRGAMSDAALIAAGLGPRPGSVPCASKTLPSMPSIAQPSPRAMRPIEVQHLGDKEGGAS
jgi:hypothetical protein